VGGHPNHKKAHPWVTTSHLSHKWLKSVQGSTWAELREKKYNQDRTGQQKSHKSVIFHTLGEIPRKGIAMKFGTGVDVLEVLTWADAEFDLENLMGLNFTGG